MMQQEKVVRRIKEVSVSDVNTHTRRDLLGPQAGKGAPV